TAGDADDRGGDAGGRGPPAPHPPLCPPSNAAAPPPFRRPPPPPRPAFFPPPRPPVTPRPALIWRSLRPFGTGPLPPPPPALAPRRIAPARGPTAPGRSPLLAFIGGFLAPAFPAAGRVLVDGEDVTSLPAERRRLGLLFQDDLLFPHLSVGGNLGFGLAANV